MEKKKKTPLPETLVVAGRVQRLLQKLPAETQRTVLDFCLKLAEEAASQPAQAAQ